MAEGTPSIGSPNTSVANLCTLYELQESVFDFLRDTERIFITEAAVTRWLNEAYVDLNARLRLNQVTEDGTTDADGIITLPDGFYELESIWFDTIPVTVVDDAVFESYFREDGLTGIFPDRVLVRFFANQFETFPIMDTEDYTIRYIQSVAPLVEPSDQPTALTPELCVRLRKYALAEAWTKEGEVALAQAAMAEYLEGLPGRPRLAHRMRPAPMALIPEAGPFGL